MQEITAFLVDDEPDSREVMTALLKRHFPNVAIVGEASNAEDAFAKITELKPHLVFLDIQMPKADGFSLLKRFEKVPFEVIFATSFDQYAINAIRFSALDYLMKPVETEDLRFAVNRAIGVISGKQSQQAQVVNLLHSLEQDARPKIAVHAGGSVKFLSSEEIVSIEGDGRYSHISMTNADRFTAALYLKDFEEFFGKRSPFVRISKSQLVNISHIESYSKGEPCFIRMDNGEMFETSRRRKQDVLAKISGRN